MKQNQNISKISFYNEKVVIYKLSFLGPWFWKKNSLDIIKSTFGEVNFLIGKNASIGAQNKLFVTRL